MRGVIIAEEDDFQSFYIDKIFDAIWKDGLNMNDQNIVDKVVKNIDVNPKTFFLLDTGALFTVRSGVKMESIAEFI